ncbi:hypothetical protein KSS87_008748, partial [Heliosperma pusillum]
FFTCLGFPTHLNLPLPSQFLESHFIIPLFSLHSHYCYLAVVLLRKVII